MRKLAQFLIRLYPAEWRTRYGEEFSALIEDSPARVDTIFDLCKGAIGMQFDFRSFSRTAVLLSAVGMAIGFCASYLVTPAYTARAELEVLPIRIDINGAASETAASRIIAMEQQVLSRTSLSVLIKDPALDLYPREQLKEPLEDVIEGMRTRDIRIVPLQTPAHTRPYAVFTISFSYSDPRKAQKTVQGLITRFQQVNELEQNSVVQLAVLDPPRLPERPDKPNRAVFAAYGFGAGLVLAALIALTGRGLKAPGRQEWLPHTS